MTTIAVFGSATTRSDEADYIAAQSVGRALGEAGYTVMTGGYTGIMEAASRGASEAGASVIGVTCAQIEVIRPGEANRWVTQQINYPSLNERLNHLIFEAEGYVVMPGGLGTATELIMAWQLIQVNEIPHNPLVCYGKHWQETLGLLFNSPHLHAPASEVLSFADSPEEVIRLIQTNSK